MRKVSSPDGGKNCDAGTIWGRKISRRKGEGRKKEKRFTIYKKKGKRPPSYSQKPLVPPERRGTVGAWKKKKVAATDRRRHPKGGGLPLRKGKGKRGVRQVFFLPKRRSLSIPKKKKGQSASKRRSFEQKSFSEGTNSDEK